MTELALVNQPSQTLTQAARPLSLTKTISS